MPKPQDIAGVERLAVRLEADGLLPRFASPGRWVQVNWRGAVLCGVSHGTVIAGDQHLIAVETEVFGTVFARPLMIRACEALGDGRCVCAGGVAFPDDRGDWLASMVDARAAEGACTGGAERSEASAGRVSSVAPLGNTGITTSLGH